MDLSEIRTAVLNELDDPAGDRFGKAPDGSVSYARLDQLIKDAYRDLVHEVESLGQPYNVAPAVLILTVSTAAREYALTPTDPTQHIRSVDQVWRSDLVTPIPYLIRPRSQRDLNMIYPGGVERAEVWSEESAGYACRERVYVYRRSTGQWMLGFFATQPPPQTVSVAYVPTIGPLTQSHEEPTMVPYQWHGLIVVLAAMYGKGQEQRDASALRDRYLMGLAGLRTDVAGMVARSRGAVPL